MPFQTIHDLNNRGNEEDKSSGNYLHKAPDDYVPGGGLLDRYEHMETMKSYWKRILSSYKFWIKMSIYGLLQYLFYLAEFGSVFFSLAFIYAIYASMASPSPQDRKGIRSAYSVINIKNKAKNARIHGDQSFEELDKQLRGGF